MQPSLIMMTLDHRWLLQLNDVMARPAKAIIMLMPVAGLRFRFLHRGE